MPKKKQERNPNGSFMSRKALPKAVAPGDPEFVQMTKRVPAGGALKPPAINPTFDELLGSSQEPDFLS